MGKLDLEVGKDSRTGLTVRLLGTTVIDSSVEECVTAELRRSTWPLEIGADVLTVRRILLFQPLDI